MALGPTLMGGQVLKLHSDAVSDGTLVPISITGVEAISRPYRFDLELISEATDLSSFDLIRKDAHIAIKRGLQIIGTNKPGIQTLKIHGMISSFEQHEKGSETKENVGAKNLPVIYRAVLVPRIWRLSLNHQSRVFQNVTVPEIVAEVLKCAGFSEEESEFVLEGREYPKREYVVQYQESDLSFISRLLESEGIFYFFRQGEARETIVFGDQLSVFESLPGDVRYLPIEVGKRESGDWFQEEVVKKVALSHKQVPNEVILRDYNHRKPDVDLKVSTRVDSACSGLQYEYGDHYQTPEEGEALAGVRAEELRCRERIYNGSSTVRSMRAGSKYTLSNHYRSDFNQVYLVTEVRHQADQSLQLGAAVGALSNIMASYENEFVSVPVVTRKVNDKGEEREETEDLPFRPQRITPKPRIPGFMNAHVDGAGGDEYAEVNEEGKYKVRLPFDLSEQEGGKASRYVRMAQPYTGKDMGIHFPLHKGTEVVLSHVDGDPDRPIISAAMPNPELPSVVTSENKPQCVIKSAGNNWLIFEDLVDNERIFLQAEKTKEERVKGTDVSWVGEHAHRTVEKNEYSEIKGERHHTVQGDFRQKVKGRFHGTYRTHLIQKIGGEFKVESEQNLVLKTQKNLVQCVTGDHSQKSKSTVIEVSEGFSVKCGNNFISIDSSGITLEGTVLKMNCGGAPPPVTAIDAEVKGEEPNLPLVPGEAEAGSGVQNAEGEETPPPDMSGEKPTWIEVKGVDEEGNPIRSEAFQLWDGEKKVYEGRLDQEGKARVEGIQKASYEIRFPYLEQKQCERG